jgi:Xaa-Pro aminopeptidase
MFCRERDPTMELWNGYRAGPEGACARYGADDAFPIGDMDDILPGLIEGRERVYYAMGRNADFDRRVMQWVNVIRSKVRAGAHPPGEFLDLDHLLHDLRLYKSAAELRVMREAGRISAAAHCRAMTFCQPGMYEFQLEAEILHEFGRNGSRAPAYGSIVGSGANGCILHYRENDAQIRDGDLVLIDAGCELEMYASDVTRTFPVNGTFSEPQRELYDVVLKANRAATKAAQAGNHWNEPHDAAVVEITKGLKSLGLLEGRVPALIKSQAYRQFFMHRTGHWLGLDVHDVGDYKVGEQWRLLEPGMVMTIEPGIYVSPAAKSVARRWRGIGIRIEDDVLITRDGPEVLTAELPSSADEIERHMGGGA